MDGLPQRSGAFSMNDAHFEDSLFPTSRQVIRHQLLHFPRAEGMQVQCAVNGQFNRLRLVQCYQTSLDGGGDDWVGSSWLKSSVTISRRSAFQMCQSHFGVVDLVYSRISVFPDVEEFFILLDGFVCPARFLVS
jgi:hypothetical protein